MFLLGAIPPRVCHAAGSSLRHWIPSGAFCPRLGRVCRGQPHSYRTPLPSESSQGPLQPLTFLLDYTRDI